MKSFRKYITLIALGLAGGVMYVYPYIRYVFHNPLCDALHISDTQSGLLLTAYGVVSLLLYIPGGILADKLRSKRPLVLSMCWAFVLLVVFAFVLSLNLQDQTPYFVALGVWILMPFATTFVFWSSLVKAVGMAGSADEQGRVFGIYFAANAVFGTVIASTNMFMFTKFSTNPNIGNGFLGVTLSVAFFILVAIVAVLVLFKEDKTVKQSEEDKFKLSDVTIVLKNPQMWLASITMMLIYMMFTTVTYFTPYMVDVCGLSSEASGALSIFRTYFIMIFAAIFSGIIADKVFKSTLKWFRFASFCLAISIVVFILCGFEQVRCVFGIPNNITVIALISILPGIFSTMIYAIQFSVLSEVNIPAKLAGTAAGLASMFVFSPDIYFNTALGAVIDSSRASGNLETGYLIIFVVLIVLCVLIFCLCCVLIKLGRAKKNKGKIKTNKS